jgi:hypothetical protein
MQAMMLIDKNFAHVTVHSTAGSGCGFGTSGVFFFRGCTVVSNAV